MQDVLKRQRYTGPIRLLNHKMRTNNDAYMGPEGKAFYVKVAKLIKAGFEISEIKEIEK
tara:strand:+ start:160 stop:336 length:177 start_codon:yes stop_codon:yes gene_type:complete